MLGQHPMSTSEGLSNQPARGWPDSTAESTSCYQTTVGRPSLRWDRPDATAAIPVAMGARNGRARRETALDFEAVVAEAGIPDLDESPGSHRFRHRRHRLHRRPAGPRARRRRLAGSRPGARSGAGRASSPTAGSSSSRETFSTRSHLRGAGEGVEVAYYLVHGMGRGGEGDFEEREREAARNFAEMAKREGVARVVYLGGLGDQPRSKHLRSRARDGEILRRAGPPADLFPGGDGGRSG